METERWDMFKEIATIHEEVDRIFDGFFRKVSNIYEEPVGFTPPVNMYEDGNMIVVEVTLPGVKKEDIDVSLKESNLTISGFRSGKSDVLYYQQELQCGNFEREITIPVPIRQENIHAEYTDGILKVSIPRE